MRYIQGKAKGTPSGVKTLFSAWNSVGTHKVRLGTPTHALRMELLASAAAAALPLSPVYSGAAHFTKFEGVQTAAELAVFLERLLLLSWHLL